MQGLREVLNLREVSLEKVRLLVFPLKILSKFGSIIDLGVIKGLVFQSASVPSPFIVVCCCVVAFLLDFLIGGQSKKVLC